MLKKGPVSISRETASRNRKITFQALKRLNKPSDERNKTPSLQK
jgi:hypothetical protein